MLSDEELHQLFYMKESGIHGNGLFARNKIKKGDYMGEYDGPIVSENGMHVLWVEKYDDVWVGRNGQNLLRYMNHSKKPHAEFDGFKLYAARNIMPDEEITIDYGEEP
ncbi:MAG: SET domain-containing protein-lysine N-methyltransferase [Gammaproteobacteria bacterium]|nr:SET domain-containing protein-lysine N-methyltransferase [Gammaproteobacteria bacterium]